MRKIIIIIISVLLASALIIVYTSKKSLQEPPKLTITIGDNELQYITAKNKWNGAIFDRQDTFHTILKEGSGIDIPYIELDKIAVIKFKNNPPDKFTISDILIDKDGKKMYSTPINNIPLEVIDDKYSFKINKNIETNLDSNWVPNKIYNRGFRIIATWGENECEYAFIIKTT